jgi:hypothetical protein
MALRQQAALDTGLAPVGRVGPGFFPRLAALSSSPRPSRASPLDPAQIIKLLDSDLPELEKNARFYPEPIVRRRMGTQFGLVQSLPLAASAQHVEDRICTTSIGDAGSSTTKAMRIDVDWQQRLEHGP